VIILEDLLVEVFMFPLARGEVFLDFM